MYKSLIFVFILASSAVSAQTENFSVKVERLVATADSLLNIEHVDSAIYIYRQAVALSKRSEGDTTTISIYNKLGHSYLKRSQFDKALEVLSLAQKSPSIQSYPQIHAKTYSLLGVLYEAIGDFEEAHKHLLHSLRISESINDSLALSESFYKIGNLYYSQKNYADALDYYKLVYDLSLKSSNVPLRVQFLSLSAMGSTYEEMHLQDKSLQYNLQSLDVAQATNNEKNIAYAMLNIGENYTNLQKYDLALEYLSQALAISQRLKAPRSVILSQLRLGELYIKTQKYNNAIGTLGSAYELSKLTGSKSLLVDVTNSLSVAYQEKGDYRKANQLLREYTLMKDSLINESSVNEINKLNTLYDVEKKEALIRLLEREKELAEVRRQVNQRTVIGLSVFLTALAALLLWVLRLARQLRESNKILQDLNSQVESQNLQLQSYNEELRQYAYVASHDLQEPLRTIGSFVSIIKRRYTNQLDEQAQQYMDFVTNGVSRLQLLLKDLLAYTRIERENTDFVKVETKDIVTEVISSLQQAIQDSGAQIDFDGASMPAIMGNRSRLGQVFQNLISNGIKFRGDQSPIIEVGCMPDAGKKEYLFYVKDNGIGIPEEFRVKMFEMFTRLHSRDAYEGSGIGLATCRKIVEKHGGKIWAESEPGMGSAIFFTLPFIQ